MVYYGRRFGNEGEIPCSPIRGASPPTKDSTSKVNTMPAKAKTDNSEAAKDENPEAVDYAAYIKRLGTLPALLEKEPNDRLQQAVDDVLSGEELGLDEKLMSQLIASLKTTLSIHGSENHKAAVPQRVRTADPKRQAYYDGLDAEMKQLIDEHMPLVNRMVELGFGMRATKDKETGQPIPFSVERFTETLNNKNHEANPYTPTTTPSKDASTEVKG